MICQSLCYIDRICELSLETLELRHLKQNIITCFKTIILKFIHSVSLRFPPTALLVFVFAVRVDASNFSFAYRLEDLVLGIFFQLVYLML